MGSSDWITIIGSAITVISMAVSIRQAKSARKSSRDAMRAKVAVQLAALGERLKSTQEHIRDIAPSKAQVRGYDVGNRFDLILREFDNVLSALPKVGPGSAARKILTQAQTKLNDYEETFNFGPDSETWRELQVLVQDTISELLTSSTGIGGYK